MGWEFSDRNAIQQRQRGAVEVRGLFKISEPTIYKTWKPVQDPRHLHPSWSLGRCWDSSELQISVPMISYHGFGLFVPPQDIIRICSEIQSLTVTMQEVVGFNSGLIEVETEVVLSSSNFPKLQHLHIDFQDRAVHFKPVSEIPPASEFAPLRILTIQSLRKFGRNDMVYFLLEIDQKGTLIMQYPEGHKTGRKRVVVQK